MPTLAVIADAEVQPGAIVSSSLMTRMRDNNAASFNAVFTREAGDFPLVFLDSGNIVGGTLTPGVYAFSATSGFSGSYRFVLTLTGTGDVIVKRNGSAVTPLYTASTTVDVAGWSRGDTIEIVARSGVSSTTSLTGSISADAPSGLGATAENYTPGGYV
jgi:hypothetical protein